MPSSQGVRARAALTDLVEKPAWTQHRATPAPPAEQTHAQGKGDCFVNEVN